MDFTEKKDIEQETVPETITIEELETMMVEKFIDMMVERGREYAKKHPEKRKKFKINFEDFKVEES